MTNTTTEPQQPGISTDNATGIRCPSCNSKQWRTLITRHRSGCTKRTRQCKACKRRIRTREVVESLHAPGRPRQRSSKPTDAPSPTNSPTADA